jgi:DNA-binding NtrC family response regulator
VTRPRIYLFEDEESLRDLLRELLQDELDADVVGCSSFGELKRQCEAGAPDLILADFWGTSYAHLADDERDQIRKLGEIAPMVLVSARQWAQATPSAELGLAALVAKPLDLGNFIEVVRGALQTRPVQGLSEAELTQEQATNLPPHEALSVFVWSSPP